MLFIRLRNLGETVLDTANLRALKHFRPDLKITTLVEAIYTDLYTVDLDIAALGLPRATQNARSSFLARVRMIRALRRQRFNAVINLHGGPTSAQLTFLSGAKHRVAPAHFRNGYAYNLRIPSAEQLLGRTDLHTVESQFAQFRWLGLPSDEPEPTHLFVAPQRRESILQRLGAAGIDVKRPYAVLAPTNEFYTKRWMPDRFAAVAEQLIARGLQIVLTGAPTDEQREQVEAVKAASSRALVGLNHLNIGELVALIAEARLFVGNDSGPAHIASAVKTPQVVLFGPASSVRWRPWRAPSALVQNPFACNPCAMYRCEAFAEPECIRSITVAQVMAAIETLL